MSIHRLRRTAALNIVIREKQRIMALFLFVLFTVSLAVPPASVIAATMQNRTKDFVGKDTHSKPFDQATTTKEHKFNYPSGLQATKSKIKAATDAKASGLLASLNPAGQIIGEQSKGIETTHKITPHELTDKRTATSTVSVNKDGSLTQKNYFAPKFYKKDNHWVDIDTTLAEDKNAGDSDNIFGKALGQVESWTSSTTNFTVTDNDWQARFSPSDSEQGMVRIKQGKDQIGFVPVNAKKVAPVVTTDQDGIQMVHYYDLWPGVNVDYIVESDAVKENIVIKHKNATNSVAFKLLGATLKKQKSNSKEDAPLPYSIEGAFNNEFAIAPANLILNNFGFVSDRGVFSQDYQDGSVTISVDKDYLQSIPENAFPAVVDPTTFKSNFGTRDGGNYKSFKSDGYVCPASTCNPYAGSLYDSNNVLRYWRSIFYAPYNQFKNSSNILTSASLHLVQRTNAGFWTGTTSTHTYYIDHATCLTSYNCHELGGETWWKQGTVSTLGNIDVTNIYNTLISRGDFSGWLMLGGKDGSTSSFKNFDPGTGPGTGSYVSFTYGGPPADPSITSPTTNQVYVDPQPSFSVNGMANPNGSTPLQYEMMVSSGEGGTGTLITSGKQTATQWTIPDNILQDGSTYYVQARSYDPITATYSNWGTSVPFRIDMRTGKDKTQTYDTIGPVSVDLATGDLSTSASSHTSAALGGNLGVSLDYNSPLKSRNGLVGEYWNVATNYTGGAPTSTPNLTRVDQNINFDWNTGSPSAGTINNDWFYTRWSGYFIAPSTGDYYFGGSQDDTMSVSVNNQLLYNATAWSNTVTYGTASVHLTGGQVVPMKVEMKETGGSSGAHLYVKGGVDEQIVPQNWLQTGVRPIIPKHGLLGRYFGKFDGTNTFSTGNYMVMQRTDPYLSFNWGSGAAAPGGPNDFLVKWTGYVTVPVAGSYTFGSKSDDGTKITLGTGNTVVYNDWTTHTATEGYGTSYTMSANTPVPITIEYFDTGSVASFDFKVKLPGSTTGIVVPNDWLSPNVQVLPDGWSLGMDADGRVNYDHLKAGQNSAILTDSTGDTHEYKWTVSRYVPPVNEDGDLVRNADGTFTLQDVDGMTYVFGTDGTLTSVTSAVDDRKPAALQYVYQSGANSGPVHLYQIKDSVDSSRNLTIYYSGDSNCSTGSGNFDSSAPAGMICAVITNDGRATNFYYIQGQLARVAAPGNQLTDYGYESVANSSGTVGYRMTTIRDSVAMDAIAAEIRSDDVTVGTSIGYDELGRVTSVTQPAPTATATRVQDTIEYLPGDKGYIDANGNSIPGYTGMTKEHVVNASEPNGFTRRIKYDHLYRTIEDTDITNNSSTTQWDDDKDIVYSAINAMGLMSSTVYDDEDRAVTSYGPAPKEWFDTSDIKSQVPLSTYASQIPRSDSNYDENIVGPAVAWYDYTKQTGNTEGALTGAPKLHATGINATNPGTLSYDFTTPPVTATTGAQGIGLSATGKLRLANGTYTISADTSDGIRVWADDQLVLNQWVDAASRTVTGTNFTVSDNTPKRFRVNVYRRTGSTGTLNIKIQQSGGFAATTDWSNYLKPDYSLPTSAKTYDSTLGDSATTVNYGSNPELGLVQSVTSDPSGTNLTASSAYEQQGASGSFLRQTTKNLPGNTTTNPSFSYTYYGATETRQNPCDTTQTYKQAGMLKFDTEASPDGGTTAGRTTEMVYDDAGRVVATRTNSDDWTCTTYDSRGRVSTISIPAYNGEAARTVSNDYAVDGNPLEATTWDGNGWVVKWFDLLGRTVKYRDIHGDETTSTYDDYGHLVQRVSVMGTETFGYDTYYRLASQMLDGTSYATVTYDQYNRVDHVNYPDADQMNVGVDHDSLERANKLTYSLNTNTLGTNAVLNPSLEQSVTTPGTPDNWNQDSWGTNTPSFSYVTNGNTGTHSVKIDMTSYTDGDAKWFFNPVDVTGGVSYTFSDYYKSNVATSVIVQYTKADNSRSYETIGSPAAANSVWTHGTYTFTTPADTVKATVFHIIDAVGWLQIDDAALQRTHTPVSVSDTVNLTQSNRVQNDIVASGSNNLWSTFGYDGAGRLTSANIGPHTYSYGFGAQDTSCGTGSNMNPNAGKNGNRTTQTIDGTTTTFCYDYADRLVGSSDPSADYTEYDTHGNITYLGTGNKPLRICYDSSDRNICLINYDSTGTGDGMYYSRDVTGRVTYREHDTISAWNWTADSQQWYGYTGDGGAPDYTYDPNWNIVEKHLHLPGGVLLTIKPLQTGNSQKQYSLPGVLGRTLLTTDAAGTNTSTGNGPLNTFTYDPFGNVLDGSTHPANTINGSYGYGGSLQKMTETTLALNPIQMGARVYLPTIGRFTSPDPVEGGTANNYVYVLDPVNSSDYSGQFGISSLLRGAAAAATIAIGLVVASFIPAITPVMMAVARKALASGSRGTTAASGGGGASGKGAAKVASATRIPQRATVNKGVDITKVGLMHPLKATKSERFNYLGAGNSAFDYYKAGSVGGATLGCGGGAIVTALAGGWGCLFAAPITSLIGGVSFGVYGFLAGGYGWSSADNFEYGPDTAPDPGIFKR